MKPRSWSTAEEAYLRQHYGQQSTTRIAAHLSRTEKAIRSRAKVRRLGRDRRYTAEEQAFLRANFGTMTGTGGNWNRPSRNRVADKHPTGPKQLWEVVA